MLIECNLLSDLARCHAPFRFLLNYIGNQPNLVHLSHIRATSDVLDRWQSYMAFFLIEEDLAPEAYLIWCVGL